MNPDNTNISESGYWDSASRRYQLVQPPLIPCDEDLAIIGNAAYKKNKPLKILQLGVTPALAEMNWPSGSQLLAVDHCQQMIDEVWPGDLTSDPLHRTAILKDWFEINEKSGSFDLIIGDGALNNVDSVTQLPNLIERFSRLLKSEALIIPRVFALPEKPLIPDQLFDRLARNEFANPHILRMQLAMSLQQEPGEGVALHDVWQYWADKAPSMESLIEQTGWSLETLGMIDLYRDKHARLYFPSIKQLVEAFAPCFTLREHHVPSYIDGNCFPTLIFVKSD